MVKDEPTTTPSTELSSDPILDQILFISRYYGRSLEPAQLRAGMPTRDGKVAPADLEELSNRAGLAITQTLEAPQRVKATLLPALMLAADGAIVAVLDRKGDQFEVRLAGVEGSQWVSVSELEQDAGKQTWYLIRPVFYFDERSLIYQLPKPQRWFWDTLKANRWIYGWALVATVIINIFGAAIPFFTMAVYDRVVPNNSLDSLWVLAVAAVTVILFDLVSKIMRGYLVDSAARKGDIALSSRIFAKTLSMRAVHRPASGAVLANIVRDFEAVRDFFTSTTLTVLGDLPFMLFFLGLIWLIGGKLILIPLALIPISLAVSMLLRKPLARIIDSQSQESSQRTAHLFEVMNGLDSVKCLGMETWARRKWEALSISLSGSSVRLRELSAFSGYFSQLTTALTTVLLVSFGAILIAAGDLTMGQLIAVSMLSARALAPAAQLSGLIVRWQQTKMSLQALNQIMNAPTDDKTGDLLYLPSLKGGIELRDLKFSYPEAPPTLRGINLKISPGEKVAFIGRIGSGKSTLLKILLNLYEPTEGQALIDGIATHQINPNSLRRSVGYVPQDVVLFHGDIRENIIAGTADVSDKEVLKALQIACLDETLAQLPAGLGTQVGERGERLSGGQRQTIAIARAVVRKPTILLLDEPSSMMDPATENRLIQNLKTQLPNTTVILVTHRMAMLPMTDRLVVFNQGQIVADGPREEVIKHLGAAAESSPLKRPVTAPTSEDATRATKASAQRPEIAVIKTKPTPSAHPKLVPGIKVPTGPHIALREQGSGTTDRPVDTAKHRRNQLRAVHEKARRLVAARKAIERQREARKLAPA